MADIDKNAIEISITGPWLEDEKAAEILAQATSAYPQRRMSIRDKDIEDVAAWEKERVRRGLPDGTGRILRIETYRAEEGARESEAAARLARRQADARGLVPIDIDIVGRGGSGKSVLARLLANQAKAFAYAVSIVDNGAVLEPGSWPVLPDRNDGLGRPLRIVAGTRQSVATISEMREVIPRVVRLRTGAPVVVPDGKDWLVTHIFAVPDPGKASGEIAVVLEDGRDVFSAPAARLMEDYAAMKAMEGHAALPRGRHLFDVIEERAMAMEPAAFAVIADELRRAVKAWSAFHSAVARSIDPYGFISRRTFTFVHGHRMPDGRLEPISDGGPIEIEIWMMEMRKYKIPEKERPKDPAAVPA